MPFLKVFAPAGGRRRGPPYVLSALALAVATGVGASAGGGEPPDPAGDGERIYRERCRSCHGTSGEGVAGKYSNPLAGDRTVEQLARYIERAMPDDDPETCVGQDARDVARYIHEAFYSPIARARLQKARVELSRLTVRQVRNALADLIGGFRGPVPRFDGGGLRGEYFDAGQPGGKPAAERTDPEVRFDFGRADPSLEKLGNRGFAARWTGSMEVPDTGDHEFIIRTDHAARLWINDPERPLIDAWVKSGSGTEHRAALFLVGGRAYPLRLEFTSRKQGVEDKKGEKAEKPLPASIELAWQPPGHVAEAIPSRRLSPARVPEVFVLGTAFPPDDRSMGYDRGTSISRAWEEAATGAAIETADHVAGHLEELAGLREAGGDREARAREFCRKFVERAFRRPLAGEEERLYIGRRFEGARDLETAVKRAVILALKSPRFLYLDPGPAERDPFSSAARLSFALWDSLPDRALDEAAAGSRLDSPESLAREAERMAHDPRARTKLREFFHRWLGIDPAPELAKDRERYPGFDARMASDLRASLDLFLDEAVLGKGSDFRRLFLSGDFHLSGRAARFYGFDIGEDAPFGKVVGGPARAAGVLSHPYLLARAGSPIHRGVFIARSVLGRVLRPPPEAVSPLSPELRPDLTTRERVSLQTAPEACQSCHGLINPLGFALERYDAVGRYREKEAGKRIEDAGSILLSSGETVRFAGARELAEFLAASEDVQLAFVTKLFHTLVQQPILAYGPEAPSELRESFAASGFDVPRLAAAIAAKAARAWGTVEEGSHRGGD